MSLSEKRVHFSGTCSARIPIRWSHLIDENTRQFMNVEHVLVGKAGPLFRDMLCAYSNQVESPDRREYAPIHERGACPCRKSGSTFPGHALRVFRSGGVT